MMQAQCVFRAIFRSSRWVSGGLALLLSLSLGWALAQPALAAASGQIQVVDSAGNVGQYSSLVLDNSGNPVISYFDATNEDLKLLHCGNATCSSGNTIQVVDSAGRVGAYTALVLDSSGNPVISYINSASDLKLAHCGNPTCSSGNTIQTVERLVASGVSSLALDSSGNPVISYGDTFNNDLKLAHCGNPTCSSGNTIQVVDSANEVGWYSSLALDSSGNPVISYADNTNQALKVVHCGDAACSSGNVIQIVDSGVVAAWYSSLVLDSSGNPVISYYGETNLKLVYCGNATCSSGNVVQTLDSLLNTGLSTSLALDSRGNPVVSYYNGQSQDLLLMHCGNAICTSDNVIFAVDRAGDVGSHTSLALDSSGNPIISYYDNTNGDLKVARVVDDTPVPPTPAVATWSLTSGGQYTALALDSGGNPVISYYDQTNNDLLLLHCGDATCSSSNSVWTVDSGGTVGQYSSLALDSRGNPVISYFDASLGDLKLVYCGNPNCTAGNSNQILDRAGWVGSYTSLALDSRGYPVISYYDQTNGDLKVVYCGNPTCSSGNIIQTVDSAGDVGRYTALVLDSSGNPVISYYDETNLDLKVVHCGNPTCTAGGTIGTVDSLGYAGRYSSLALNSSGNPVISYYDNSNQDLKLAYCGNPACTADGGFQNVDRSGDVGQYTSLALDSHGYPIISYYDSTNRDLKLVRCGNATCSKDNVIRTLDNTGDVGQYVALKLASSGNPVISYFDSVNTTLKLARPTTDKLVVLDIATTPLPPADWINALDGTTNLSPQDYPGYCLNLQGNVGSNGTAINLWACTGHNSQKWVRYADKTLRPQDYSAFCLNLDGNVGADGATVNLWRCNGSTSQQWNADANHNLHPQDYPGYCLNLHGNVAGNGTAINLWSCTGHNSQKWHVSGAWITGLDGTTNLNPQDYPGYCLNLHYNDAFDGGVINLWSCNSHNSKKWVRNADQTIRPKDYPNFCLNLHGNVASNGATINLWSCNGSNSQKWNADPSHNLHPQDYPDYCLNLHGNVGADGATINLWSCNGHNSQKWNVTAAPAGAASVAGDAVTQPLTTTTEVAAAPAVVETAAQPQRLFLPLVANNGVMAASTDAPSSAAVAAVTATTAPTLPLTAADPNAGGGSLGAAQPVTTTAPAAVITPTAPVSVPVTVDAAPVVTATGPTSAPVTVASAAVVTASVPATVPAVVEAAPAVSASVPVTVPAVVEAAPAVTAPVLLTTTQPLTDTTANPLAGTAVGSRGGLAVLALVGLAVVVSLLWQRQRMNYR